MFAPASFNITSKDVFSSAAPAAAPPTAGAAAATVIGQVVSAVMVIVYAFKFKTVKLEKKHFIPQKAHLNRVVAIGMASCFNQIAIGIVQVVLNNSLKHYGELSSYGADDPIAIISS